ncbi:MAG: outer membrane protein assembly factor BamE [Gammaproteobacteria bacterium]|nr:outer membrane protein assembly factor BamE [Gammaproteobacteria bacterium]
MVYLRLFFIGTALFVVSSCSIYKMNIRQGNIIEQKQVSQIKPGMTKGQVQYLLGRPLVNDTFSDDTWYYLNTNKDGKTGEETQQKLFIEFANDKVISMKGDFELPGEFATNK